LIILKGLKKFICGKFIKLLEEGYMKMEADIRQDIREILTLQRLQSQDIASIKAFQKVNSSRIDEVEREQKKNTGYRNKSTGAIALIYILIGLFGSLLSKKI